MLQDALDRYNKQQVAAMAIINALISIAQEMRQARQHGDDLGLSEDETAFYDALANNKRAVEVMGDDQLALFSVDKNSIIARELIQVVCKNVSIDWTVKESTRAQLTREALARNASHPAPLGVSLAQHKVMGSMPPASYMENLIHNENQIKRNVEDLLQAFSVVPVGTGFIDP
jgi:hypothetical protein